MKLKDSYSVGYRSCGGAETEKRGVNFIEALDIFVKWKQSGLRDVWIYYDPHPEWL